MRPQPHPRGLREGVVVVVEALAEREDAEQPVVRAVLGGALPHVAPLPPRVRGVADRPVAQDPRRAARAHADRHAARAEGPEDHARQRQHVQRPGPLEEAEPGVAEHVGGEPAVATVVGRLEPEVEVPKEVPCDRVGVGEVAGAVGSVLPIVAHRVEPRPGERAAQAAQDEEPGEHAPHEGRGLVAAVDDPAVESHRVAHAEGQEGQCEGDAQRGRRERRNAHDEPRDEEAPEPEGLSHVEAEPAEFGWHEHHPRRYRKASRRLRRI